MHTLDEALDLILEHAEPGEAVEMPLPEALGLVLAEPLCADVDLPPFDRAARDGYAVRAIDAHAGGRLRVVDPAGPRSGDGIEVGPGQAAWVAAGSALPVGADALLRDEDARPGPATAAPGRARWVVPLRGAEAGRDVVRRRDLLAAGTPIAPAGARLRPAMVGLLAAQGCVAPVCHRRVRVAVLAVGDDLVGPGDAPVLSRVRNAANLAVATPLGQRGAVVHDLGVVSPADLGRALHRALHAPVTLVMARSHAELARPLARAGVEQRFEGVALRPGGGIAYGVVRTGDGSVSSHVFILPLEPVAALVATVLLAAPLVARLQGDRPGSAPPTLRAVWRGGAHASDHRATAVPVSLGVGADARFQAWPVAYRGPDDLAGFAHADALAILPARGADLAGGELVEVIPLGPFDAFAVAG